jgi:hypothetical protein
LIIRKSITLVLTIVLVVLSTSLISSTFFENFSTSAQITSNNQSNDEIVLLSQRYNNEEFGDRIVGEVLNNGTSTAEFVKVTVSFYDVNGLLVGTEMSYADPSTIEPNNKSPFTIFISGDAIENEAENYEFTLQWRDIDGNDKSVRVAGDTSAAGNSEDNENTNDSGEDNSNDSGEDSSNDSGEDSSNDSGEDSSNDSGEEN